MSAEIKTASDIFECKMCGQCCKGFGGTYVTEENIDKISRFIKSEPKRFTGQYCDPSGSRFVLTRGGDGCCIFFKPEKQCTIHPVKPYMCKAWPFIKTLIENPENWDIMADSCPGMKKGVGHADIQRIVRKEKENLDRKEKAT